MGMRQEDKVDLLDVVLGLALLGLLLVIGWIETGGGYV